MIYLDNAATSWPKPETVYLAMDGFLRHQAGNPGRGSHSMAAAAGRAVDEARLLAARLINAERERVVFTLNCTDALNLALKGLLKPGDHVITSSIEHNSMVRPLRKLEAQGVRVTWLPPDQAGGALSPAGIERAICSNTRLLATVHVSNVSGVVQPVADYGAVARRHGLVLLVDAAQSAGHFPIDVAAAGIDLLAFSGHKGLLGPPGTGVLYVGERAVLDTLREGGTGTHSESEEQPAELPYRYEAGTLNSVGIAGLGAATRFLLSQGVANIQQHEERLTGRLIDGLEQIEGVTVHSAAESARQGPVVSCNVEGYEPGEVGVLLDQAFDIKVRTGLHCAPAAHRTLGAFPRGTVRLSPGYFNTEADIDEAIEAMRRIAAMKAPARSSGP